MSYWSDWGEFFVRWIHLIAGISWIGNSFYFMWLDARANIEGEVRMVHGGGYYEVKKKLIDGGHLPKNLHWFKWEATFTWVSGFFLFGLIYFTKDAFYLIDPNIKPLSSLQAVTYSLVAMGITWILYDSLWQSKFAKSTGPATLISLGLVTVLAFVLCHLFSGRGAFILFGGVLGTLMVLNVWIRILPSQSKMLELAKAGKNVPKEIGLRGKWRSTHNSYLTLPVLFSMLSTHLPSAYGHDYAWILLILLAALGGLVRHMMIGWNIGQKRLWILLPSLLIVGLIGFMVQPKGAPQDSRLPPSFQEVRAIINERCVSCHSLAPTDTEFPAAQAFDFTRPEIIHSLSERIRFRSIETQTMPPLNKTKMTDDERATLNRWIQNGAKIDQP